MTLAEIKQAIEAGKTVKWSNDGYDVIKDSLGQYLIIWDYKGPRENCIGLTWRDGVTLNCNNPSEFYIKE